MARLIFLRLLTLAPLMMMKSFGSSVSTFINSGGSAFNLAKLERKLAFWIILFIFAATKHGKIPYQELTSAAPNPCV
jgi:hypothetical protein